MLPPDSLVLDGRFRVIRPIGSGGMGEVYLGEQVSLGRKVAIKVLHHDLHMQPGMMERFKREARLLSAVEHPAVVRIIDFGESGDAACLVMELVEGESLFELLRSGPLAPARALLVLQQLAEGLAAIHDRGIIHRDIKPENVFLTRTPRGEQARLLDFGIARLIEPDADSNVSQVGVVLGTPEYLSPEQAIGARVDVRSDLYCLGVLAYRVLSGRLPFDGPDPRKYIAQHANAAPLPLDRAAPSLSTSRTLVALVMRLLEKDPANRFQTAHVLADALAAAASEPLPAAVTPPGVLAPSESASVPSGTAAFGAAPPGQSLGSPDPESLPPTGSGTAVFGADPAPALSQPLPPASAEVLQGSLTNSVPWARSQSGAPANAAGAPTSSVPWDSPASGSATPPVPPPVPPPAGSSTAVFGVAPPALSLPPSGPGGGLAGKPQNLTLMLTSIQGFGELTSRQTREEHLRMLETYEQQLLPLLREYEGKLVQKMGDALLAVFGSPTGAVLCGMGMQDRLWRHNQGQLPGSQLHVRICLHAGEVLMARDTVLGEPMEVVKSAEQVALAGEVTFTESVNLARNRAEVVAEPCGTIPLPGRGEPLQLYRSKHTAAEGPPFGGRDLGSVPTQKRPVTSWKPSLGALRQKLAELASHPTRRLGGLGLTAGLLLAGGVGLWWWDRSPEVQARRLLEEGKLAEALKRLDAVPAEDRKDPELREVRALALHALKRHDDEHEVLLGLPEDSRDDVEDRLLDGLAEDFGAEEGDKTLRKLLGSLPKDRLHGHLEALAEGSASPKQWGALRYLEASQDTEGLDLVELYSTALASQDCDVRAKAARRLGALGDADAVPALKKLTEQSKEKQLLGSKNCGQDEAAAALQTLRKSN
ncbi:protein kinase domain-containing protein [Hyalangium sp.]|uniref:protein kinase domain-containing protein n=1 Tax=Hyalangium sp. TaxID=2028555 RepID=UPI002D63F298|nr:protein kinase [Hyalangium sp.]HYH97270.1 protein kinase [Hyalangium sp.]